MVIEFFGVHGPLSGTFPLKSSLRLGGQQLFVGPSLWFATQRLVFNVGIAAPIMQNKDLHTRHFILAADIAWKFNG